MATAVLPAAKMMEVTVPVPTNHPEAVRNLVGTGGSTINGVQEKFGKIDNFFCDFDYALVLLTIVFYPTVATMT